MATPCISIEALSGYITGQEKDISSVFRYSGYRRLIFEQVTFVAHAIEDMNKHATGDAIMVS